MKEIFKRYFFTKHVLVSDSDEKVENNFQALFSLANYLNIRITKGEELASLNVFKYASAQCCVSVPEPFYVGFPESVRKLTTEQLLFDQLVHYAITYGIGDFSEAGHSLFNEQFERIAFKEKTAIRDFVILTESEAYVELEKIVDNLLRSTRSLNDEQYNLVYNFYLVCGFKFNVCDCKDTACRFIMDTEDVKFAKFLNLSDFVRLVEYCNCLRYGNKNIKKLNLRNKDRKLLTKVLDFLLSKKFSVADCYEKQSLWCGILHHLHYKPKNDAAKEFLNTMRSGVNKSFSSEFESLIASGNVEGAAEFLLKNKGASAVLRKLNYLISRCKTKKQIEFVLNTLNGVDNNIVLIQNYMQYSRSQTTDYRIFKFTRFNKLVHHTETKDEFERRQTFISKKTCKVIATFLKEKLAENLKGKLGKVYIENGIENIALPLQENTSMGGYGTLPKGSVLDIDDGKKIRAFIYWERVNDIDLSAIGITSDMKIKEFSWRTMFGEQSEGITFSGDETSGFKGGSEYFDIEFDSFIKRHPQINYLVMCANVYSAKPFSSCICKAGYMKRDIADSGEIYEPKTVETSFNINCDSTMAYLFALDVKNRKIIWLNIAKASDSIVAASEDINILTDYFSICDIMNYKIFFTMAATEIVKDPADADVIIGDKEYDVKEGVEIIRTYETEKVLKLLNE